MRVADAKRSACRSCGAPVVWVVTEAGKRMPLDPEPRDDGNIVDDPSRPRGGPNVIYLALQPMLGEEDPPVRYVSHFSTCKDAVTWRNR